MMTKLKNPPPLKQHNLDHVVLELLVQKRPYEAFYKLYRHERYDILPKVSVSPEGKELSEWINSLSPSDHRTIEGSWLMDVQGWIGVPA